MLLRVITTDGSASELVFMHYVGILIALPCPRVTFCYVISETCCCVCVDTQLDTLMILSLMHFWYKITLQALACAFTVEHSITEVYLPADFSILFAQILEIMQLTLYKYNKKI